MYLYGFVKIDNKKKDYVSFNMLIVNLYVGLYYYLLGMDVKML